MRRRRTVLLALVLILTGSYLLLSELNVGIPGWREIWPVLPLAGGLALIANYILEPQGDPDLVFFGTAAALVGLAFFAVTVGPLDYDDLGRWWPAFLVIASIAFLAQWAAAGFTDWDALFLGLVALVIGGVAFATTFQLLGPDTREILPKLWPALLILAGLMALLRGVLSQRTR